MQGNNNKIKLNKKEERKKDLQDAWQNFKNEIGGLDDFGKKTSNAGFQLIKSFFSIVFCVIVLVIAISLLKGE